MSQPQLVRVSELRLDQLGKRRGQAWAVRDVSLYVRPGELCTLLGGPGAGKTTVLHMVAGLERPDAGRILLDAVPIDGKPPGRRGVALVFRDGALWPHMTVLDNVAFGLRARGLRGVDLETRAIQALRLVGLDRAAGQRPHGLGAGDTRRVALARALAVEPRVLLLDDPLWGLPARDRQALRVDLGRLQRELCITTLAATQDEVDALALSSRLAVLVGGRVLQEGRPEDIYWRPDTRAVAERVGAANLVPVRVVELREVGVIVEAEGGARLPAPSGGRAWSAGERGCLCLRPEALALEEAELAPGGLPGTVVSYLFEGGRQVYQVAAAGVALRVEMPSSAVLARGFKAGDRVKVTVAPETAVLLPVADSMSRPA